MAEQERKVLQDWLNKPGIDRLIGDMADLLHDKFDYTEDQARVVARQAIINIAAGHAPFTPTKPCKALDEFLRDWIHETPLSLCGRHADSCPDWDLAKALAEAIELRHASPSRAAAGWANLLEVTARQVEQNV